MRLSGPAHFSCARISYHTVSATLKYFIVPKTFASTSSGSNLNLSHKTTIKSLLYALKK